MNSNAIQHIQQQIERGEARLLQFIMKTPTFSYPKRHIVIKIEKYVRDFQDGHRDIRWIIVPGLRGVGKTTAMAQVFVYAKRSGNFASANFLYISADDLATRGLNLIDAIDAYEYLLNKPFEKNETPTFLFIDEVQQEG